MSACGRETPLTADRTLVHTQTRTRLSGVHATCIRPAKQGTAAVVCQAVGQAEVVFDQDPPVGSVHVGGLDLGRVAVPVGPVQVTVVRQSEVGERFPPQRRPEDKVNVSLTDGGDPPAGRVADNRAWVDQI